MLSKMFYFLYVNGTTVGKYTENRLLSSLLFKHKTATRKRKTQDFSRQVFGAYSVLKHSTADKATAPLQGRKPQSERFFTA